MPIETGVVSFGEWFPGALLKWVIVAGILSLFFLIVATVVAILHYGPSRGLRAVGQGIALGAVDLVALSPRRVWAIAWLSVKESFRGWIAPVALVLFVILLLYGGLVLDPASPDPGRLYLGNLFGWTTYIFLLLVLLISVFGIPADIQSKRLHTVVTKPVRSSEIVFGRIAGFAVVGTALLAVVAVVSYAFVVRGLAHTHTIDAKDLIPYGEPQKLDDGTTGQAYTGMSGRTHGHRHRVDVSPAGEATLEPEQSHWHDVAVSGRGTPSPRYTAGGQTGLLVARVPIYGKIVFRDRDGMDVPAGISVGDEWTYRSYIQGGTQAAAIYTISNLRREMFPDGEIPVEMNIGVFRTHKGNIEKGVLGSLSLRNPETGLTVEVAIFESKEFTTLRLGVPAEITKHSSRQVVARKSRSPDGPVVSSPADLDPTLAQKDRFDVFDDLVADGKMEIWLRCLEPAQYFGAAQPDVYIRAGDAPFEWNYIKGFLGVWIQMVLIISFGVMFSTFLSGPVAMIATLGILVVGMSREFLIKLAMGETFGGGPIESAIRMVTQENMISELSPGLGTDVTVAADTGLMGFLYAVASMVPPLDHLGYATHVAYGFNISGDLLGQHLLLTFAYLVPLFIAGYFCLKTREIAA